MQNNPGPNDPTYQTPYTQYPPFAPPPPPPKRRRRTLLWIILGALLLVGIFTYYANTTTSTPPATTQAPAGSTPVATQPPAATQAPTKAPAWTTIQKFSGNGSKKTASFTVPDNWRIGWTCNPASDSGINYNVIITVENADGSFADSGVTSTCSKSNTHDTTNVPGGGTFILDIISEGDWTIEVQVLK